jgi:NDP-sugar pyrophosphorylase family protein
MDWPDSTVASALFPSFTGSEDGALPMFPSDRPAWCLLDPSFERNLKAQMATLAVEDGAPLEGFFHRGESVMVHESATVEEGAYLIGPCYIGPRAVVRSGAYVREHSWICADAVVGHATEVKHSILLPGAKAPHFNYVGDSILGKDVNLGAGTKLSNLRNDGGEVHLRVDGERVASGLRKFGALLGEGAALGCNSVTNPGVVLGCNSVVWPNVTVTGVHGAKSEHR